MKDESDQVERSQLSPQSSALCERLLRRHTEPIGIINVREAERLYERIVGWIAGRLALVEYLMSRYRIDDLSGDGQPLVMEQSFWEMIKASATPAQSGSLPSQSISSPPVIQYSSREVQERAPIKTSVAPVVDSDTDPSPPASTKFRVSRRPPQPPEADQAGDLKSQDEAALKSAIAPLKPDEGQLKTEPQELRDAASSKTIQPSPTDKQEASSSLTAREEIETRQTPSQLELAQTLPVQSNEEQQPAKRPAVVREITGEPTDAIPRSEPSQLELAQASPPQPRLTAPEREPAGERTANAERKPETGAPSSSDVVRLERASQSATEQSSEEAQAAEERQPAKRPAVAREITGEPTDAIPRSEPSQLELAQASPPQPRLTAPEREPAGERTANAGRKPEAGAPSSSGVASHDRASQPATEQSSEEAQAAGEQQPAKQPAVVREITGEPTDAIPRSEPSQLELAQASPPQPRPAAGEREHADEKTANAEREYLASQPLSSDAVRQERASQPATEQSSEEAQAAEEQQPAKRPAVAREITNVSQSRRATPGDIAPESPSPQEAAETTIEQPRAVKSTGSRSPVSPQDSPAAQTSVEINRSTRQTEQGKPIDPALTFSSAPTAERDASSVVSQSQKSASVSPQSGSQTATEIPGEASNSKHVDFIWRDGSDAAAAEIEMRQRGDSAPRASHRFDGSASSLSSSPSDRPVAQEKPQGQGGQIDLEKIPDHMINSITQQVIRALSRILTVERERKGIR
jgi:hypothetical protein